MKKKTTSKKIAKKKITKKPKKATTKKAAAKKPRKKETRPRRKSIDISNYIAYAVQRKYITTFYGTLPKGITFEDIQKAMPHPTLSDLIQCGGVLVSKDIMPQSFTRKNPDIFKKNDGIIALTEKAIKTIILKGDK